MWQESAARRDFKPDYVGFGSLLTEASKACRSTGVCFTPDTVAKRFLASDRRTFFHFRARMGNFDSKINPFGFYYCPFCQPRDPHGDFCNTIPPIVDNLIRSLRRHG